MAQLLDGKKTAKAIRARIKEEVDDLSGIASRRPHAVFVQVGNVPASTTYVNMKYKMAQEVGMLSTVERLPGEIGQQELLALLHKYNTDRSTHAILVQLPLPSHIDEFAVMQSIAPAKDLDCFHPENIGRMVLGLPGPKPATPQGILMLLDEYKIDPYGMNATIVGRSNLVGKPLGLLLLQRHATVTWCHTRTRDLPAACRGADLLVSASGKPGLVHGGMVKPGAVVVDVGTNYVAVTQPGGSMEMKLVGDVAFDEVEETASYITPVPGGVGPMTIASVLYNALTLYKLIEGIV
jgi:methylenetetrahydrofolate dehydrogenase (NADP+) / methenyltetrahydrofolate cyclohydrolase